MPHHPTIKENNMRKFINSAAFLGFVATGTMASAQGVLNNAANQVGNAVSRTTGQAQNMARGAADGFRNRVDDAAANSSIQSNGIANSRANRNGNVYSGQNIRANVGQNVTVNGQSYNQNLGTNAAAGYQHHNGYTNHGNVQYGQGQTAHHLGGHHVGMTHHAGTTYHHGSVNHHGTTSQGVYTLRHDASGREYICVSGQRVYFDGGMNADATGSQQQYQAGYGNADQDYAAPSRDGQSDENDFNQNQNTEVDGAVQTNQSTDANRNSDLDADVSGNANAQTDASTESRAAANTNGDANLDANTQVDNQTDANVVGETRANAESNVDAGFTPDGDAGASTEVNSDLNGATGNTDVDAGVDAAADLDSSIK
ncbi:MAG TPA: hypothetical protein DDX19_04945 [Rhodopirellula baltica]|nr:hypothetical protein [Rhodopirellula baltica]